MATDVVMPKLGLTMTDGLLVAWLVSDGDAVNRGQALYEIETDKATMEAEAPADGIIKILMPAGESVNVNARVGIILAPDEAAPELLKTRVAFPSPEPVTVVPPVSPASAAGRSDRKLASPAAKRVARELGIDIQNVVGGGEAGRVEVADVQRFAQEEAKAEPTADDTEKMLPDSSDSKTVEMPSPLTQQIFPITLTTDVDATGLLAMLDALNARHADQLGFRIVCDEILVYIAARTIREFAPLNACLENGAVRLFDEINVGVPIEVNGNLLSPVIRQADTKSVVHISQELHEFVARAQHGTPHLTESAGSSFTITNLGSYNIDAFTPIINPPAVACLGAGRIVERPVNHDQQISLRPMLVLSLTVNSQCVESWQAARFLNKLRTLIEMPFLLIAG